MSINKKDWTKTKAVWDGEDWRFTEVPLEACPNWGGTTCFSPMELNYNGDDPVRAVNALMYWCEYGESQPNETVCDGCNEKNQDDEENQDLEAVQLYYVMGIGGTYYGTKMQAEAEARKAFPKEDAIKRYSRVYYKTFYQEI